MDKDKSEVKRALGVVSIGKVALAIDRRRAFPLQLELPAWIDKTRGTWQVEYDGRRWFGPSLSDIADQLSAYVEQRERLATLWYEGIMVTLSDGRGPQIGALISGVVLTIERGKYGRGMTGLDLWQQENWSTPGTLYGVAGVEFPLFKQVVIRNNRGGDWMILFPFSAQLWSELMVWRALLSDHLARLSRQLLPLDIKVMGEEEEHDGQAD